MITKIRGKAFSLIEISVVILIIGIFLAASFTANEMITKFRITSAKNLTQSSPITSLSSVALWLETSLDSSFNSSEAQDGASLSTWYDQRPGSANKVVISTAGASPTYSNTINRIHAVEFDGTTNKHFTFDGSFLNNTDYTIFVLEKRKDSKGGNYFLGEAGNGLNNSLALGYSDDKQIIHAQGTNSYLSGISSYLDSKDKPRVFTFSHSSSTGNQTYINGVLASENTDVEAQAHLTEIGTLAIGKDYIGEIGEIVIFSRSLGVSDRNSIEDYLGKKWSSSINRNKTPNCIGGLVTPNGCDNSSPVTCSASGVGYDKTGLSYTSGNSFSCNVAGYSGTISYKCLASGSATNISGNCTPITCTATGTAEYSTKTNLPYSTGNESFSCDPPYYGTKTYTCTTSGEATAITGTCTQPVCTAPAATGYGAKSGLPYSTGSGSFFCDTGYSGTITYTCTTPGEATAITGTCVPNCTGGTIDTSVSGKVIHRFTSVASHTFSCPTSRTVQVLVVGGGGSGGNATNAGGGGGGGAGGVVYASSYPITSGATYNLSVGAGGAGASPAGASGLSGGQSTFGTITALGGGGGGTYNGSTTSGTAGGSGGGGGGGTSTTFGGSTNQTAQTNASNFYGNIGGAGASYRYGGGAGGGAGGAGANGTTVVGGNGGVGISNSITGSPVFYAAGGGGSGGDLINGGDGGSGIGGNGAHTKSPTRAATAGADNTGSGGGGANKSLSGAGGSGVVIVSY